MEPSALPCLTLRSVGSAVVVLTLAIGAPGCYATATLAGPSLPSTLKTLQGPPRDGPFDIAAVDADDLPFLVRVDPNSEIRFYLNEEQSLNGSVSVQEKTTWIRARDLDVTAQGVRVLSPLDQGVSGPVACVPGSSFAGMPGVDCVRTLLPWSAIAEVDVRTLHGGATWMAVLFSVIGVGLVALLAAGSANDDDGYEGGRDCDGDADDNCSHVSSQAQVLGDGGNIDDAGDQMLLDDTGGGTLFSSSAQRRGALLLRASESAGVVVGSAGGAINTVGLGIQRNQLLDAQLLFTAFDPRSSLVPASWRGPRNGAPGLTWGLGVRLAADLPLDLDRNAFAPFGVEFGGLFEEGFYLAGVYELNLPLSDSFRVGLRPFNVEYLAGPFGGWGWINEVTANGYF
jgi:hypothetical protein